MQTITINGILYTEGDYISATFPNEDINVKGRIHIPLDNEENFTYSCFFCQNEKEGLDCDAKDKYGYKYSWIVIIDKEGNISSRDIELIKKETLIQEEDDDKMPEDWICDETLPINL